MDNDLLPFLKQCELFKGFNDDELKALIPHIRTAQFEKGNWILQEGTKGDDLYIIRSGKAEVMRLQDINRYHELETLGPGEWVGEMALVEGEPRSASVRALEKTEVLVFSSKDLPASNVFITNLLKRLAQRLRNANERITASIIEKFELIKAHNQISQVLVHVFILITVYVYIFKALTSYTLSDIWAASFSSLLIAGFALSSVAIVHFNGYPLKFYGLTLDNFWKNVGEGILFSIPLLIIITIGKWVLITKVDAFKDLPLFAIKGELQAFHFGLAPDQVKLMVLFSLYLLLIPLQEFMARGLLQSCFRNFFQGPSRVLLAIVTANLLFGLFHSEKTFTFALAAFCFGMLWGALFEKQRSIVGCTVSHAFIAIVAFSILDYQSILIH